MLGRLDGGDLGRDRQGFEIAADIEQGRDIGTAPPDDRRVVTIQEIDDPFGIIQAVVAQVDGHGSFRSE